jgi:hypothetical protein
MGQRANRLLVSNSTYRLFYCHWCANTLDRDLFWGPEHAVAFTLQQQAVGEGGWLDDKWAEGGAVIDTDRRFPLFYGGEDILYHLPLRWVYLDLLRRVWKGWEIRWAHNGIFDIAAYVCVPLEKVGAENGEAVSRWGHKIFDIATYVGAPLEKVGAES